MKKNMVVSSVNLLFLGELGGGVTAYVEDVYWTSAVAG